MIENSPRTNFHPNLLLTYSSQSVNIPFALGGNRGIHSVTADCPPPTADFFTRGKKMSIACQDHEPSRCSLPSLVSLSPCHRVLLSPCHPPISQRRLEANRRNAQRSTGPRTKQGKLRVRQNA